MITSELSFLSNAEKLTLGAYLQPRKYSILASEVMSRLTAAIFLSPAAALDLVFHTLLVFPTFAFAMGKFIYQKQVNFTLPWQHLQRVRNAMAPLLLGSAFGILHPYAGLIMSEATDKHAVIGMLSSHIGQDFETPCSPIHSLSIVENIAKHHQYGELSGRRGKKEIFSTEYVKILKDIRNLEESLEVLHAQEFIHKIMNVTFVVMVKIDIFIESSCLSKLSKDLLLRVSGLLVPILTVVDITMPLLAQVFFIFIGIVRLISGRGPIYTEITTNPLMHVTFLIQNVLKSVGNLIGTFIWFISPITGFKVSLLIANLLFKLQMNILMSQIELKVNSLQCNERFAVPIMFGKGDCSALVPIHSIHNAYLIVEKKDGLFNLYWVDRPEIAYKQGLNITEVLTQIRSMLDERFSFMKIENLMVYPVKSSQPEFLGRANFANIAALGNETSCVVSNMFGMLEALDRIKGSEQEVTDLRYQVVREVLIKDYGFYKNDFFPFTRESDNYSLGNIWNAIERHPNEPI